jgi:hypothetical protein
MVEPEPAQGTASLAAPAIRFEDLLVQPVVGIGTQPNPAEFCLRTVSRGLGYLPEEFLPQRCGQEPEKPHHRPQQDLGVSALQMRPRQEIRTDHLQTVPPRLVGSEHERSRIDRLFDHWRLALVDLGIDQLARF